MAKTDFTTWTDDELIRAYHEWTADAECTDHPDDWNRVAEVEEEIARRQSSTGTLF